MYGHFPPKAEVVSSNLAGSAIGSRDGDGRMRDEVQAAGRGMMAS